MKAKSEILLKISFLSGAIPLVGGWGIFLIWVLGRYLNSSDFFNLEMMGFMWMIICFFVAIGGLFILLIYVFLNRDNLHKRMLVVLAVILINIPSVLIVLSWQKSVAGMQFIKITNETGVENLRCEILDGDTLISTATIYDSDSKVLHFHLYSYFATFKPYQNEAGLKLRLSNSGMEREVLLSTMSYGRCKQVIIDQDLNVKE